MGETEARVSAALVLLALLLAAGWALGAFGGPALRRRAAAFGARVGLPDAGRSPAFVPGSAGGSGWCWPESHSACWQQR
jgi:hypothetical protein